MTTFIIEVHLIGVKDELAPFVRGEVNGKQGWLLVDTGMTLGWGVTPHISGDQIGEADVCSGTDHGVKTKLKRVEIKIPAAIVGFETNEPATLIFEENASEVLEWPGSEGSHVGVIGMEFLKHCRFVLNPGDDENYILYFEPIDGCVYETG